MKERVMARPRAREVFERAVEKARNLGFTLRRVTTSFNHTASFSSVSFRIEPHIESDDVSEYSRKAAAFQDLFSAKTVKDNLPALEYIAGCHSVVWPPPLPEKYKEKELMKGILEKILLPICEKGEVLLESKYADHISVGVPSILGMGSKDTWHGTPDARVRGSEIILRDQDDGTDDENLDEVASNGMTAAVEAKKKFRVANLPQVVATSVVSSFIENNLHPNLSPMVPTVVIGKTHFRVCLFDCHTDVLLISQPLALSHDGRLSTVALSVLWMVFNHRHFLHPEESLKLHEYPSGILSTLTKEGVLENFKRLKNKQLNWDQEKEPADVLEREDLPLSYITGPPSSKRPRLA